MSSEFSSDSIRCEGESFGAPAIAAGAVLLRNVVDADTLPIRLREGFLDRPWPSRNLDDQLVSREFMPIVPAMHSPEAWTLDIVDDHRLRLEGVNRKIGGNTLVLLNLLLLSRDWSLRSDELHALGFANYLSPWKATRIFDLSSQRLRELFATRSIFQNQLRVHSGAYRLNPAVRIVDRREFE